MKRLFPILLLMFSVGVGAAEHMIRSSRGSISLLRSARRSLSAVAMLCLAVGLFVPQTVNADQARLFDVSAIKLPATGRASVVSGSLVVKNRLRQNLKVRLLYPEKFRGPTGSRSGNRPNLVKRKSLTSVRANSQGRVGFRFGLEGNGKHLVLLLLEVYDQSGKTFIGRQSIDLYFEVQKGKYKHSSYTELYVSKKKTLPAIHVPKSAKIIPLRMKGMKKFNPLHLKHRQLLMPMDTSHNQPRRWPSFFASEIPQNRLVRTFGALFDFSDTHRNFLSLPDLLPGMLGVGTARAGTGGYKVKGKFSYKGLDNQWHPALFWKVILYWKKSNGQNADLASGYISETGNWELNFMKAGYEGQNLHVRYVMENPLVSFRKNEAGSVYKWGHSFQSIAQDVSLGHWGADTSSFTGSYAGVGDAYSNAVSYWFALAFKGVNPLRPQPIKVFIPNTWHACNGVGEPGCCARAEGDDGAGWVWLAPWGLFSLNPILLMPDKMFNMNPIVYVDVTPNQFVIRHELAHQMNFEFWNNQIPPYESLPSYACTAAEAKGRALIEGFADAVTYWTMYGENAEDSTQDWGGGYVQGSIESPLFGICKNESVPSGVAGTFWDLLDTHADKDGMDNMFFADPTGVFSVFLAGGYKESMLELEDAYVDAFGPVVSDTGQLHPVECVFTGNFMHGTLQKSTVTLNTKYQWEGGCSY